MSSRERVLSIVVLGLLLAVGGGVGGYMFVYSPLQDKKKAAADLTQEVDDLDLKVLGMLKSAPEAAEAKRQSLPPDPVNPGNPSKVPTFDIAKAQYKLMLERLLTKAGIRDFKIPTERVNTAGRPPVTPEIAAKKPAYTTLTFVVDVQRANIWQLVDFLYDYYQLDLLHQITDLKITRENKLSEGRGGLKAIITFEALVLDGAVPRTSLFPVGSAVAAVGGQPAVQAVIARPELLHRLTTISSKPVLATTKRDYSYIALKDIFYGPIPPYVEKVDPFALGRLDDVRMARDEKPKEVRVRLSGEGATGATVVVSSSGSLLSEDSIKFDPKTGTITIPPVDKDAPDSATSTVSVLATSANKVLKKGSFTVSVEKTAEPPKPTTVIDSAIRLVIVSIASDGTAEAIIKDNANPFRYIISISKKDGMKIEKWWQATGKTWKKDRDYEEAPNVLKISDEETATKRTFRVVAIEQTSLILSELATGQPPKEMSFPGGPPRGPRPPMGPARQGRADPIAAVAGAFVAALPKPTYYRWQNGKSLKELDKLSDEEVKAILSRVAEAGPIGPAVVSAGN